MSDLKALFSEENLEAVGKDFVEQTKSRLKKYWDLYPEEVKKDIEATARLAASLALEISTGNGDDPLVHARLRHLNAQLAIIQIVGALEFRLVVAEVLDTAAKVAGTFFKKALIAGLTGGLKF
jgi:hypothetical protein